MKRKLEKKHIGGAIARKGNKLKGAEKLIFVQNTTRRIMQANG